MGRFSLSSDDIPCLILSDLIPSYLPPEKNILERFLAFIFSTHEPSPSLDYGNFSLVSHPCTAHCHILTSPFNSTVGEV